MEKPSNMENGAEGGLGKMVGQTVKGLRSKVLHNGKASPLWKVFFIMERLLHHGKASSGWKGFSMMERLLHNGKTSR